MIYINSSRRTLLRGLYLNGIYFPENLPELKSVKPSTILTVLKENDILYEAKTIQIPETLGCTELTLRRNLQQKIRFIVATLKSYTPRDTEVYIHQSLPEGRFSRNSLPLRISQALATIPRLKDLELMDQEYNHRYTLAKHLGKTCLAHFQEIWTHGITVYHRNQQNLTYLWAIRLVITKLTNPHNIPEALTWLIDYEPYLNKFPVSWGKPWIGKQGLMAYMTPQELATLRTLRDLDGKRYLKTYPLIRAYNSIKPSQKFLDSL
jgi:hypothetical protein